MIDYNKYKELKEELNKALGNVYECLEKGDDVKETITIGVNDKKHTFIMDADLFSEIDSLLTSMIEIEKETIKEYRYFTKDYLEKKLLYFYRHNGEGNVNSILIYKYSEDDYVYISVTLDKKHLNFEDLETSIHNILWNFQPHDYTDEGYSELGKLEEIIVDLKDYIPNIEYTIKKYDSELFVSN